MVKRFFIVFSGPLIEASIVGMEHSQANHNVVDLSYVLELGEGKPEFVKEVLSIFMEHTPPGLKELEKYVRKGRSWDKISKQAHFLKSSVGIVRVEGMHDRLQKIETLAKEKRDKDVIVKLLDEIVITFSAAEKIITDKIKELSD